MKLLSLITAKSISSRQPHSLIELTVSFEGSFHAVAELEDADAGMYWFRLLDGDGRKVATSDNQILLGRMAYAQLTWKIEDAPVGPLAIELCSELRGAIGRRYVLRR